ncbi:MAG TPA: hypothetical protein PKJ28_09475 [Bacteroidales bacterium]|nr:hypothetical protein [Bacteroidales bacterium]
MEDPLILTPELERLAIESFYEYIRTKAKHFIRTGHVNYTKGDAFGQPGLSLPETDHVLLLSGCDQVIRYRGLTPDTPFEGLGIGGFYRLMNMFHYEKVKQTIAANEEDHFLDKILFRHVVSGHEMVLFNKVRKER